jgi:two-component system response regulator
MAASCVLVVEDNPDDEALTLRALARSGATEQVVVKHDGAEALEFLFGEGGVAAGHGPGLPRVVLLDLHMPMLNGFEVLRRLHADARTRFVPVVILSSSVEEQDLVRGYSLGVNSWVRKPDDFNEFVDVVHEVGNYWLMLNEQPPVERSL